MYSVDDDLAVSTPFQQGLKFPFSLFAHLLKIALFKERPSAIRSHHSLKRSDGGQIALVSLLKRANVSKSLLSLFKKEQ